MPQPASQARIVVSYRRGDAAELVHRITERLQDRFGPSTVFLDVGSIHAGDDWAASLEETIAGADLLLVMIGEKWSIAPDEAPHLGDAAEARDVVRWEIETALAKRVGVMPVLLDGAAFPARESLPEPIRRLARFHAYSVRSDRFERDADGLAQAVEVQVELSAPWARRVVAFGLDAAVPAGVLVWIQASAALETAAAAGAFALYHWLLVGLTGTTLGKLLAGTRVVFLDEGASRWINALLRPTVGYLASFNPIGLAQFLLHPHASTLHDRFFRTRVLRLRAKAGGPIKRRLDAFSQAVDDFEYKLLRRLGFAGTFLSGVVAHHFGFGPLVDRWRGTSDREALEGRDESAELQAEALGDAPDPTASITPEAAGHAAEVGEASLGAAGEGAAPAAKAASAAELAASVAPTPVIGGIVPGFVLATVLAALSLLTYETLAPPPIRLFDRSREVVVIPSQPTVVGTRVLVLYDVSPSMSDDVEARDGMIRALREGGLPVEGVGVNTGGVDSTLMSALTQHYAPGMDALFFFSDFRDGDPSVQELHDFVSDKGLRFYVGTVEHDPGAEILAVVGDTGGAFIDQR